VTKAATVAADIGWLVGLWLMVPVVTLVVCAPVALLIRLVIAVID
jgi:hypothetical protein